MRSIEGSNGSPRSGVKWCCLSLPVEAIDDLIEAVPGEGEHKDQRLWAGAAEGVSGLGRDVDRAARPDRRRPAVDLHLPAAADDVVGLLGLVVMKQELLAGRHFRDAGDEADALRAFAGNQELPAYPALGGEVGIAPPFPVESSLIPQRPVLACSWALLLFQCGQAEGIVEFAAGERDRPRLGSRAARGRARLRRRGA